MSWYFPSTGHGENHGFADSLLEYFQGDHEKYIAREAIQNAVDARSNYDLPVTVVFEKMDIPSSDFPGRDELLDRLHRCSIFVKGQEKAEKFFDEAILQIKAKEISILKISDFNTKGLSGADDDVAGNWYRLVRASGTSSPKGVAGGSFGIGKGAPIAASLFRTVFYSSINEAGEPVFQGKSRLVSHHDDAQDVRQGVGFYGVDGYKAVRESELIPDIFRRNEQGTDIFIAGYAGGKNWKDKLIKSILHNFWLAIWHGNLEVIVRDRSEKKISKENLKECLQEYDAEDAKFYFEAVTDSSQEFRDDLKHLGNVSLFVRKNDGYPGRVMMVRKPKMIVMEKPYRILREPYAAVFICENDRGNALLRDMEPPAHDKWDKDRVPVFGLAAWFELDNFIRKNLKAMGETITSEPEDIPGLDRYLPDNEDRDYLPEQASDASEQTDLSEQEESGKEIGSSKDPAVADIETVVRQGVVMSKQPANIKVTPPSSGTEKGSAGKPTGGNEGDKEGVRIRTSSISFRSFIQTAKTGREYHFVITGRENAEGAVRLVAVGDDGNYFVDIKSAVDAKTGKKYETGDSMIRGLAIESGKSIRLAVQLSADKKYALGIENYEG